jgi:hypothetical protein
MPLILRLAVSIILLLVSACGGAVSDLGGVTWDPPLDDGETSTTIELGAIQQGESATATVIATNNSAEGTCTDSAFDNDESGCLDAGTCSGGSFTDAISCATGSATWTPETWTPASVTFQLNCTFENGGFLIPGCPEELVVLSGESSMPIRATLGTNLSGQYSGSFQFVYGDETATFFVQGTVQ